MDKIVNFVKQHRVFLIIFSVAVLIRLFFITFPPFKTDMDSFIAWGEQVRNVGFGKFYDSGIWTDYAPGYFYFLWLITQIKYMLLPDASREVIEVLQKLVPIIFDLATGVVLYKLFKRFAHEYEVPHTVLPAILAGIYICTPFTFFNGALWGQVDSVFAFFLALSFYYLARDKFSAATALYIVACIIKPQAVVVAPAYLLYLATHFSVRKLVVSTAIALTTFYALTGPFFGFASLPRLYGVLQSSLETYPYGSINTFNYWGTFGFWKPDTQPYFYALTQQQTGTLLFVLGTIVGFVFFLWASLGQKHSKQLFYLSLFCSYLIVFGILFLTRMHERYLYPFFVYLIVGFGLYSLYIRKHVKSLIEVISEPSIVLLLMMYVIFSLIHLINLYYVYVYYQYFGVGVPAGNTVFYSIEKSLIGWSYAMLCVSALYFVLLPYYVAIVRRAHYAPEK